MDKHLLIEINQLHAQLCEGLADPKRIAILYAVSEGPRSVTDLVEILKTPQATISRNLKILRERGMVIARREGANVYYSIGDPRVIQALDLLREVLAHDLNKRSALAKAIH